MLYKNLPDEELPGVMRVRCWLDYIAAATFVLKGQLPNAKPFSMPVVNLNNCAIASGMQNGESQKNFLTLYSRTDKK